MTLSPFNVMVTAVIGLLGIGFYGLLVTRISSRSSSPSSSW